MPNLHNCRLNQVIEKLKYKTKMRELESNNWNVREK